MTLPVDVVVAAFMTMLRTGPTLPPLPALLRVPAQTCWRSGRLACATSATVCRRDRRDTFLASMTLAIPGVAPRREAIVRSHFPRDNRPRLLRWRRRRHAPGVPSSGREIGRAH